MKNLTKDCYKGRLGAKHHGNCMSDCYEKYIKTISTVSKEIKKIAYQKHSLIGYKGFPEDSIQHAFRAEHDIAGIFGNGPLGTQHHNAG